MTSHNHTGLHLISTYSKEHDAFRACTLQIYDSVHVQCNIQSTASLLCLLIKSLKAVTGVGGWKGRFAIR